MDKDPERITVDSIPKGIIYRIMVHKVVTNLMLHESK